MYRVEYLRGKLLKLPTWSLTKYTTNWSKKVMAFKNEVLE